MFSFATCSAGSGNSFPGRGSVCCTWSSSVVLVFCKCPGSLVKGLYLHRMSSVSCYGCICSLHPFCERDDHRCVVGQDASGIPFLGFESSWAPGSCLRTPSLTPGADLLLWPPGSHLQEDDFSTTCCLLMAEGVGVCSAAPVPAEL